MEKKKKKIDGIAENDNTDLYVRTWKAGQILVSESKKDWEKYG